MKKLVGHRYGYRIVIKDGFYEVLDGKTVKYYGNCRKNSTIQEVINKTIDQEDNYNDTRNYRALRDTISARHGSRNNLDDGENYKIM